MTVTLDPRRQGPYYGHRLRRVIAAPEPQLSRLDRMIDYYYERRWPAAVLVVFGLIVACATVAAWIVW